MLRFLWPEISPGKDLALDYANQWKVPFFTIWIGVVAASLLCDARPADRCTMEASSGTGGVLPAGKGLLSPLHAVVSAKVGRELPDLGEETRDRDRKLVHFELLPIR